MEISSHYYGLLALCRVCGVRKDIAHKIAYASQFVDDAKINCFVGDDGTDKPFTIDNIATCHSYFKIRTYNFQAMLANTAAFHFVPGCEGESYTEKLICKENSPIINQIIDESMYQDPEVFGMLMHIYADTFVHQQFSGLLSKENDIENLKKENQVIFQDGYFSFKAIGTAFSNFFGRIEILNKFKDKKDIDDFVPAYGHGQAEHCPDIPYLKWSYEYSMDRCDSHESKTIQVDNVARFKRAFTKIKEKIEIYLEKHPEFRDAKVDQNNLEQFFIILGKRENTPSKIKSWQSFLIENKYFDKKDDKHIITYDEIYWLQELIQDYDHSKKLHTKRTVTKTDKVKLIKGYEDCSWLKYVIGVKDYKYKLKELCLKYDVNLHYEIVFRN